MESIDLLENGFPEVAEDMLDAMGDVMLSEVKTHLQGVIDNVDDRSTGDLVDMLGASPAKKNRDGNYNKKIGFREARKDGKINALIALVIEYGSSTRAAKPYMKPARRAGRGPAIVAAQKIFEQWVADKTK